jgi:hypothetical protein
MYTLQMSELKTDWRIDYDESRSLVVQAANVFQPRTPIATREFFAGRWTEITTLADAVGQVGLHVVIHGERGVGKTSLANVVKPIIGVFDSEESDIKIVPANRVIVKVNASSEDTFSSIWNRLFEDVTWPKEHLGAGIHQPKEEVPLVEAFNLPAQLTIDNVRRTVSKMPGCVFIVDEFDRANEETRRQFTDLIKGLSDAAIDCTITLVGVSETVDRLIEDHASVKRALVQIHLPRMEEKELQEILLKAEKALSIKFSEDAARLIIHISQGLPHYTHLIGLHAVRMAASKSFSRFIERNNVFDALKEAVKQAEQPVAEAHSKAIHSSHREALYRHVLVACAISAAQCRDSLGYFTPGSIMSPLEAILGRRAEIGTFTNHLSEFSQEKRGNILERDGQARAYRFRFTDPLMVPFVFMDAVAKGLVNERKLAEFLILAGRQ